MVGLNITNMHITLTLPGDGTHNILVQSETLYYHDTGARVFAARGKRLCCRPRQSDQFCNQDIFLDFGHWGCKITYKAPSSSLPSYLRPFPSLSPPTLLLFTPFRSASLKVGPLNLARRSGERCKLPSAVWGEAPAEIEFGAF